jgi:hypothetical protein
VEGCLSPKVEAGLNPEVGGWLSPEDDRMARCGRVSASIRVKISVGEGPWEE